MRAQVDITVFYVAGDHENMVTKTCSSLARAYARGKVGFVYHEIMVCVVHVSSLPSLPSHAYLLSHSLK